MMFRPTCPLEFARPSGWRDVAELSRSLALSSADAHRNTTRAVYSRVSRVRASTTSTPDTRLVRSSSTRLRAMLYGMSVRRPVASAAGSVALTLLKYERVTHPR